MFGGAKPKYLKLRTNLRLCVNRLKLIEKKKTEMALKARVEIADYLKAGKDDRARIRVEHIVREDYLVEAMEIVEMYCDLLLARFGLIEKMKDMDPGLEEPISTILWATPRMSSDIPELREVANQLTLKYGKEYNDACRSNLLRQVNEKVLHKMAVAAPPAKLIESYLIEIAKTYDVPFEPDASALEDLQPTGNLIDIGFDSVNSGKGGGGGGGGGGAMVPISPEHMAFPPMVPGAAFYPGPGMAGGLPPPGAPPPNPYNPQLPAPGAHPYPPPLPAQGPAGPVGGSVPPGGPYQNNFPGNEKAGMHPGDVGPGQFNMPPGVPPGHPVQPPPYEDVFGVPPTISGPPPPLPQASPVGAPSGDDLPELPPIPTASLPDLPDLPGLPSVPVGPGDSVVSGSGDIDFDDLTRRFEDLKKRK